MEDADDSAVISFLGGEQRADGVCDDTNRAHPGAWNRGVGGGDEAVGDSSSGGKAAGCGQRGSKERRFFGQDQRSRQGQVVVKSCPVEQLLCVFLAATPLNQPLCGEHADPAKDVHWSLVHWIEHANGGEGVSKVRLRLLIVCCLYQMNGYI
jgi:hypothetical protein